MSKEILFNSIRNEDVIIWAGAGLSLYAGYPSGDKLRTILYDSLTSEEKESYKNYNHNLVELCEQIFRGRIRNKNHIIKTLKSVFEKVPEKLTTHELIAKIPHFKTIITTNYDKLFETVYKENADVILSARDLGYIKKDRVHIIKIHGDLSIPDSIIITQTDYNNFFKDNNEYSTLWSVLKERLSTNSVLFLGYNLEDPNVSIVFDRITENLEGNRKECFLVAPNLPSQKITDLMLKGINYIDATAEELIQELLQELKNNVVDDLENRKVSADTFKKFVQNFNILPVLDSSEDNFTVREFKSLNKNYAEGQLNFTLKNDEILINEFNDFINGKRFGELEIKEDFLKNIELSYEGIRLSNHNSGYRLTFHSKALYEGNVTVRFANGQEFHNFPIKLYGNTELIEIHSKFRSCSLNFKIDIKKLTESTFKFNFKHDEICQGAHDEYEIYNFLKCFSEGNQITIFTQKGEKITKSLQHLPDLLETASFFAEYFKKLQLIEKKFNIKFSNFKFNEIGEESTALVDFLTEIIRNGMIIENYEDTLQFEIIPDYYEDKLDLIKAIGVTDNSPIVATNNEDTTEQLHGQSMSLGYQKLELLDPIITNINDIINKSTNLLQVQSRTKSMRISFIPTKSN